MRRGLHPAAVAATSEKARRDRLLSDRIVAAFPRASLRLVVAVATARPSPLRTALARWAARRTFDAYSRRDWEINTFAIDPTDYELTVGDPGLLLPDMRERYVGVEGYLEAQAAIMDVFPDLVVITESVGFAGPRRLIGMLRWQGTAAASGIAIDQPMMTVADFPNGLVTRQSYWVDRDAGLRKLGLTPPRL